jgi:alkanesulfonate monooxygenase SsuD/methylene tetrahydromethanopterin reductase-like flavin-dependent oxidoreductase (luciferase family)
MQFGLQHPSFSFDYKNQDASQIADALNNIVTKAENAGFDSFWVMDHFHQIPGVGKPEEPMLESWTTISFLAGITSKIKLGTLITGNIYRDPSILAKIGATLDETVKRKLTILKEHCTSVSRDYASILKTKLGIIEVENDKETARKKIQVSRGMPEEQINEFAIYGTPEDVLRQIELFEEAGIQYLIVNLDPSRELEALDVFKENIIRKKIS